MRHVPPQMLGQVVQHRARRADRGRAAFQSEPVERRDLEMFAQRELRGFGGEGPVIVAVENPAETGDRARESAAGHDRVSGRLARAATEQCSERVALAGKNNLRRAQALEFGQQRGVAFQFAGFEIARGEIRQGETIAPAELINGGQVVVPFGAEHPFVEMRAGTEDLGDGAFDELAGPRVFHLVADGHLSSCLEEPRDIAGRRVKRNAAHRHDAAPGERDVEQLRAGLCVLEKEFVKIAQAEEQQRVIRQFALDAPVLRHHRSELRVAAHGAER